MPIAFIAGDQEKQYFVMARCDEHKDIPQLNVAIDGVGECGACEGLQTYELLTHVIEPMLDAYADRLTHHAVLKQKLGQARNMLNLLSPGAGDWLDADVDEARLENLPPLE